MNRLVARSLIVACVVALVASSAAPAVACECLNRLMPWNWGRGASATYVPAYSSAMTVAPAYVPTSTNSCGASCGSCTAMASPCMTQTCAYLPQTSYQTVYRVTPVTAYQPVATCDPCTGCATTCYRPVTYYQRCAQLIPYTTYRMVLSNPCATSCALPTSSCVGGCATGCYGTSVQGAGCSSCATTTTVSPATAIEPAPSSGSSSASTFNAPLTTPPAASAPSSGAPATHQEQKPVGETPIAPIPEPDIQQNSLERAPAADAPNKTAQRAVRPVIYLSSSSTAAKAAEQPPVDDADGWVAAD